MASQVPVKISRDLEVVQIPEGYSVRLARGTEIRVSQSLGGTFTATTEFGTMVRIYGKDADAIGELAAAESAAKAAAVPVPEPQSAEEVKERVWTALRGVFDPEIPVNVVELGLVYNNDVATLPEGGYKVDIKMTLTAPGCGMGDVLKADAERLIKTIPKVQAVTVTMVLEPVWNISMVSEAARLELGL